MQILFAYLIVGILLWSPASASEIVAINCPQGVIVVADKRLTYPELKCQTELGKKVTLMAPYLIAATGTLGLYNAKVIQPGMAKLTCRLNTLDVCAQLIKELPEKTLVCDEFAAYTCKKMLYTFERCINEEKVNPKCEGQIAFSFMIFKTDVNLKRIENAFIEYKFAAIQSGKCKLAPSFKIGAFEPQHKAFRIIGDTRHGWERVNQLKPNCNSFKDALNWAESELLGSHEAVVKGGFHTIGNVVDEYLVGYDGKLKVLALGKRLGPRIPSTQR